MQALETKKAEKARRCTHSTPPTFALVVALMATKSPSPIGVEEESSRWSPHDKQPHRPGAR